MPEKHFYFSIGALFGSLLSFLLARWRHVARRTNGIISYLYSKDQHWFLYFPLIILFWGMWGLVPDIVHALGLLPKAVTRGAIFDIFFFHSTFEYIENHNHTLDQWLNWVGELILLLTALGVMVFYIGQVRRAFDVAKASLKNTDLKNKTPDKKQLL